MPFNIEQFKSEAEKRGGVMRNNKFQVRMFRPTVMPASEDTNSVTEAISFWCQGVNLPGYQEMTYDIRRWTYGPSEKRPFTPNFQPLQLIFIGDGNMDVWKYFHTWQHYIIPHDRTQTNGANEESDYKGSVYELEYKRNYAVNMEIMVYRENGKMTQHVKIQEAFPSQVLGINLNWQDINQYTNFAVVMDYLDWHEIKRDSIQNTQI